MDYRTKIQVVRHGLSEDERQLTVSTFIEFVCQNNEDLYLPPQTLTRSETQGLTFEEERSIRQASIMMIKHGSVLLKLSGQVSATACSIFHRFFYRYSFFEHDPRLFAAASLFLSAKLEETPRKYKDVISVFHVV